MRKFLIFAEMLLIACSPAAFAQRYENHPAMKQRPDGALVPVSATVSVCVQPGLGTSSASVTSNVATLTFGSNPQTLGFVAGQGLTVSGFSGADTYFNGTGFTIGTVSATQITYALTHSNGSATSNGAAMQIGTDSSHGCAPTATLYSDATLATPCSGVLKDGSVAGATNCSNPLITDARGNYHFYPNATAGPFTIQIYGSGLQSSVEPDVNIPTSTFSTLTIGLSQISSLAAVTRAMTIPDFAGTIGVVAGTPTALNLASFTGTTGVLSDSGIAQKSVPQVLYLQSAYTNSTTSFTNVTGISFSTLGSSFYKVRCDLDYQTSATTANIQIQWTGPASPNFVTYDMVVENTTSALTAGVATAFSTALAAAGTPTISTNFPLRLSMTLKTGLTSGTVQLQAAATGTGTITIIPGSCSVQQ